MTSKSFLSSTVVPLLVATGMTLATGCPSPRDSVAGFSTAPAGRPGARASQSPDPLVRPPEGLGRSKAKEAPEKRAATGGDAPDSSHGESVSAGAGSAVASLKDNARVAPKSLVEEPDQGRDVLFKDWPTPRLALFITGQQQGYIEPCGCTGLSNQKGGLSRRQTLATQLAEKGWPLVAVDAGNQVRRFGRQAEIMFQVTIEGLKKIGYRAIALGVDDLRLSAGELLAVTSGTEDQPSPFVCANAAVFDPTLTPAYQIVEAGGKKVGVTAILGTDLQKKITSDEIVHKSPEEGLGEVVPKLKAAGCDLYVLLAHASIEQSKQLARQFPDFDVVVTAGGLGDPTYQPEEIPGSKAILVQVGVKGMHVGVVGVFDDDEQPLRYQRVPLDGRFEDSRDMLQLLASYQEQLKELGLDGLGVKPIPHPSGWTFAGSESCADCHTKADAVWRDSGHAKATHSLVHPGERSEIPRHFDPECLSCHVTGWNPQKFFPYISGYLDLKTTPLVHTVGCENCHGPGSQHVAAENGDIDLTDEAIEKLRVAMRLPLEEAEQKCVECHDLDNSPDFHEPGAFEKYWKKVEHKGME